MSDHDLLQEYYAELRGDFCNFVARCFTELVLNEPLVMGWHIELMTNALRFVIPGEVRVFNTNEAYQGCAWLSSPS